MCRITWHTCHENRRLTTARQTGVAKQGPAWDSFRAHDGPHAALREASRTEGVGPGDPRLLGRTRTQIRKRWDEPALRDESARPRSLGRTKPGAAGRAHRRPNAGSCPRDGDIPAESPGRDPGIHVGRKRRRTHYGPGRRPKESYSVHEALMESKYSGIVAPKPYMLPVATPGSRPGWASLVMLGDCGSPDASSNLAPGPPGNALRPRSRNGPRTFL